jgi:hypothetical protein
MKIHTERRKQIREAEKQELPHWANSAFLDAEMKRRLEGADKARTHLKTQFCANTGHSVGSL